MCYVCQVPRKLALRRLQHSESTFFQPLLEQVQRAARAAGLVKGSAQKAINLDKKVFHDQFYPLLPDQEFDVRLTISGPDDGRILTTSHPISKPRAKPGSDSKNWRLHGSTIRNPANDPYRYDHMAINDFLFMEFFDDALGAPGELTMQIMTRGFAQANDLEITLDSLFAPRSNMEALSEETMALLCDRARRLPTNPLLIFDEQYLLEAAAAGEAEAVESLLKRSRNVSREELLKIQQGRDRNGFLGEKLVAGWLTSEKVLGRISGFVYEANINAIAPYDFDVDPGSSAHRYVDVKTTSAHHEEGFYLSGAELNFASQAEAPYEIYRVSQLEEDSGVLRISEDIRKFARSLTQFLDGLPEWTRMDTLSIQPAALNWGDPVKLHHELLDSLTNS